MSAYAIGRKGNITFNKNSISYAKKRGMIIFDNLLFILSSTGCLLKEKKMKTSNSKTIYFAEQSIIGSRASSNHSIHIAKALKICGFKPIMLINEDINNNIDIADNSEYFYKDIPCIPVGSYIKARNIYINKIRSFLSFNNPSIRFLKQLKDMPFAVILQTPGLSLYYIISSWCKKNNVRLFVESMEWHNSKRYKNAIIWIEAEIRMRFVQRFHPKLIVISRYLQNYYLKRGNKAFYLPPLIDVQDSFWLPRNTQLDASVLKLVFAGSPQRERHDIILGAILRAKSEGINVVMEYVGSTRKQMEIILKNSRLLDELGDSVFFHGVVNFDQLPDILSHADYAVLIRDDAKWSRACFPSKIPELLSLGIPIICNFTSDLSEYIEDGKEAFVLKELTEEAFTDIIRRAVIAKGDLRNKMSYLARKRAENDFDILCFSKSICEYFNS